MDADQYIPYPLDEVALDFQVLEPTARSEGMVDVMIAACRQEHIESRQAAVELSGLIPEVIDIEAHCVQRAIALDSELFTRDPTLGVPDVLAILDIGADMTTLSVVSGTQVLYTREQSFGGKQLTDDIQRKYDLTAAEAVKAKKFGGLPDDYEETVLNPFKEALLQQIMRSLQFFYSGTTYNDVDRIVLAGGTANLAGLDALIEARLGTPCSVANPFDNMRISDHVDADRLIKDAPSMMIACGLAMRNFD
jgi:type IV pilus assembly protein PilM